MDNNECKTSKTNKQLQHEINRLKHELAKTEEELHQKIEATQTYYEDLIALLPGHVYWMNKNNEFLGCNNLQAKSANLPSRHDIVGKTNFDMPWRGQAAELNRVNELVMSTGQSQVNEEYAVTAEKGGIYLSHKVPIRNKQNEITGLLGVSLDISNLKALERKLRDAKSLAEAANAAKSEFLANMRHDIRTPLSGIVGFAELLKSESNDPRIKEYASNLVASSHALLTLMDEVLEAVRVSSGEIPRLKRKFNLVNTFEQIITLYQARAHEKKLTLSLTTDKALPQYVIGDKIRLHRIALELIGNALNFTDSGYVTMALSLEKKEQRELVIKMTVSDSGMGIPQEKQQEIYLQFKRLTPSYQGIYKGAGLGLYIVKQFMDELGGEIYVDSKPREGTVFTCLIPLQAPLLDDDSGVEPQENVLMEKPYMMPLGHQVIPISSPNTEKEEGLKSRVLVVEDNFIAQTVAKTLLSQLECQVDVASNGMDALALAKEREYDLIFMDIGLGEGIDGYDVTCHIRTHETKHTPIIALTAHGGDENRERCIKAGMDAVLSKPLTQAHAIDVIKTFILKRQEAPIEETRARKDLPDNDDELFQLNQFDLLNSTEALKNCATEAMFNELVTLMTKNLPDELACMKKAFLAQDYTLVEKTAHKIKGGAVYVGTVRMKYACQYLERYWKSGQRELFEALYHQAVNCIEETLIYLKGWLQNNSSLPSGSASG